MRTRNNRHAFPLIAVRSHVRRVGQTGFVLLAAIICSCSQKQDAPAVVSGKVVIKGSNTVGEELAPRLISDYKKEQPQVTIELESKNTGSGLAALAKGQCDIASASRVVTSAELMQAQTNGVELNAHTIGSYSVAVVANSSNPVKDLSRDQIRDIFTGTVQNWKEVGGSDGPIHLYVRDAISGTYLGFRELAMEDKPYAPNVKTFTNYAAIVEALAKDPAGIGYCGFDQLTKSGVKGISIRGVTPNLLSVEEGRYPYSRILRFYTSRGKESPQTLDFIRFVQSPRGQEVLISQGFVQRP
jgi:phosphate transport system substrate-binding protein